MGPDQEKIKNTNFTSDQFFGCFNLLSDVVGRTGRFEILKAVTTYQRNKEKKKVIIMLRQNLKNSLKKRVIELKLLIFLQYLKTERFTI